MKVFLLTAILLIGCTRPEHTKALLESQGYSDVKITGFASWACGKEEYSTGFRATNHFGKEVEGSVCDDLIEYSTIKFK
jgi:hypothetical protein